MSYCVFIALIRSLAAAIDSEFGEIYGMIMLRRKNLSVFAIYSALVLGMYM